MDAGFPFFGVILQDLRGERQLLVPSFLAALLFKINLMPLGL